MANGLVREKSVYLQQHAHNPVNWQPWGEAALAQARRENKILFVSIGYSTCHWCHVMERESFEDAGLAADLNENFVCIKVDREEQPEVDQFFMEALHRLNGRGGWPLNMFATPDLKPFFGGTYFPKTVFADLLQKVSSLWVQSPDKIIAQADGVLGELRDNRPLALGPTEERNLEQWRALVGEWQSKLLQDKLQRYDPIWGGFGQAPKFPRSHAISALLRAAIQEKNPAQRAAAQTAVQHTLRCMAYGGLRDHLRGGFHRYSTDEQWLAPHFEKMLYDQALLMQSYSEAYRLWGDDFYRDIVEEIHTYLEAEMRLPSGLYAAAQDADSEGEEGKFYVWTFAEVMAALPGYSETELHEFCLIHSVLPDGNWEGKNILSTAPEIDWGRWKNPRMREARQKLLALRAQRIKPLRDDKALVSWNAWMSTALLTAAENLSTRAPQLSSQLLQSAQRVLSVLDRQAGVKGTELAHVIYANEAQGVASLEDYSALIEALQLLASSTLSAEGWQRAELLLTHVEKTYRNEAGNLLPLPRGYQAHLPTVFLQDEDGATPAALSVYVGVLLRQALHDSQPEYLQKALAALASCEAIMRRYPLILSHLLNELDLLRALVLKVGAEDQAPLRVALQEQKVLSSAYLWSTAPSAAREACDLEACFAREKELSSFLKRVQEHFA